MDRIVIVGAGPVGSLLALTLARRGYEIDVYERRLDMRRVEQGAGRSINLAVSTRGLYALHAVGLDQEVLASAVPMLGRSMHSASGARTFLRYGKDDSEFINSMSRGELNKLLMTEAERTGRVRIHFERKLTAYDPRASLLTFDSGPEVRAPIVIGSDGSASALRASFPSGRVSREVLPSGYKELTMPPLPGGGFAMEKSALHIWPRGSFMLIALPNRDGSFTCTLFLAFAGTPSFAGLQDSASVRQFFEREFPDALALIPGLADQFLAAPLGQMVTIKAQPWAYGGALLIGDSAHAIVPFFGQGMNAGFEDVTLLEATLGPGPSPRVGARPIDPLPEVFERFAAARKPDTDAIADLAVENFVEMQDKVSDPVFLRHKAIEAQLQQRFPGEYISRYQLVTFTRVPYRVALRAGQIQQGIFTELGEGEIDYERARRLIRERLVPLLAQHGLAGAVE